MVWLKETFDINYSVDQKLPSTKRLEFDDNYVEKVIEVLPKLNCIIRKLIYDYINLRITQINYDLESKNNLNVLVSHFNQNHYLMMKLSYTSLAYPQKVMVSVFNVLKRSKTLRRLKRRWIEKPLPIHQVES